MKQLEIRPVIYEYGTFLDFAKKFHLGKQDLILTNEYIYQPIIENLKLPCPAIFQEKYGNGEPTDVMVDAILKDAQKIPYTRVLAVGGGTVIDIAKVLALGGAREIDEFYAHTDQLSKAHELVIIPTTCGTGSEVTNIAVVNRTRIGTKTGLVSEHMFADAAVLIPEFLRSLPYKVFATSSIDALIHAVESFLNPAATSYTEIFAVAAIKNILAGYKQILAKGKDARFEESTNFLRASNCAGIAFGNSGCGAVHAMSYAFGGKYHVPHGESNYQFLTSVLKIYKKKASGGKFAELEELLDKLLGGNDAIHALDQLLEDVLPKKRMSGYGAVQSDVPRFADSTVDNQQRLLKGSYVPLSKEEIQAIYQERF